MTELEKIKILKANGWHQYYSNTHWVNPKIFEYMYTMKRMYFGNEYTNYQNTVDEAYSIYLECQKSIADKEYLALVNKYESKLDSNGKYLKQHDNPDCDEYYDKDYDLTKD